MNLAKERRQYQRYSTKISIIVYGDGKEDLATLLNISEKGCCFFTKEIHYVLNEEISIIFTDKDLSGNECAYQFRCVVRRIDTDEGGYKIGCFINTIEGASDYIRSIECKKLFNRFIGEDFD